jgi:hypothetical protein
VVSKNELLVPAHKLDSVRVIWVDNHSMPYETSILFNTYTPKKYSEADKAAILAPYRSESFQVMGQLLSFFSEQVVSKVRGQLEKNNVSDGNDVVLELFPVSIHHAVNGGRRVHVRATLKQGRDSMEMWSATIEAHGPKDDTNELLLDNFVSTLMDELKKAGWLDS